MVTRIASPPSSISLARKTIFPQFAPWRQIFGRNGVHSVFDLPAQVLRGAKRRDDIKCADFIQKGFLVSFAVRRGRRPRRYAQGVLLGMKIFGMGCRKSRFQRLPVLASQNADVNVCSLDFRKIGLLGVGVAAPEFLEHDGAHAHRAHGRRGRPAFFLQFAHYARNESALFAGPFPDLFGRGQLRRGRSIY
jgi:hypothetical protein